MATNTDLKGWTPGGMPASDEDLKQLVGIAAASTAAILRMVSATSRLANGDIVRGLVFHAIWTSNLRHITFSPDNVKFGHIDALPPDELMRPVSVLSVANCLRIPYETARRYTNALVQDGQCVRVNAKGVCVPKDVYNAHLSPAVICAEAPSFLRLLTDLQEANFDFAPYHRKLAHTLPLPSNVLDTPHLRAFMRIGCEYFLRCIDTLGELNASLLPGLIYLAIWQGDVRLNGCYASRFAAGEKTFRDTPGDPVTLRSISSSLGIPYETVRRHVQVLLRGGQIVRADSAAGRGFFIADSEVARPEIITAMRKTHTHVVRLINDLHRAGFDFSLY